MMVVGGRNVNWWKSYMAFKWYIVCFIPAVKSQFTTPSTAMADHQTPSYPLDEARHYDLPKPLSTLISASFYGHIDCRWSAFFHIGFPLSFLKFL